MSDQAVRSAEATTEVQDVAAALEQAIARALQLGGQPVYRLGRSGTSVTFAVVSGEERDGVTLLLDRQPPVLRPFDEPAEVTVSLELDQARAFARGELLLPNELLLGTVATSGPVRRYLGCDPVLRALLHRSRGDAEG